MRAIPLLCLLLGCADPENAGEGDASGYDFSPIEREIHDLVNAYRADQGLAPLKAEGVLGEEARGHSLDMLLGEVPFSHDGADGRADRIDAVIPLAAFAENVAYSQGPGHTAAQVVDGWIDSPGHHANLVGPFDLGGVGVAESDDGLTVYYTHLFVQTR